MFYRGLTSEFLMVGVGGGVGMWDRGFLGRVKFRSHDTEGCGIQRRPVSGWTLNPQLSKTKPERCNTQKVQHPKASCLLVCRPPAYDGRELMMRFSSTNLEPSDATDVYGMSALSTPNQ